MIPMCTLEIICWNDMKPPWLDFCHIEIPFTNFWNMALDPISWNLYRDSPTIGGGTAPISFSKLEGNLGPNFIC